MTLSLLWEEYRAGHPEGYGYSRFCELYTRWEGKLSPVMRQRHPAGERLFVDYAGHTIEVIDPQTGEVRTAQLFVATLGASSYTFVEATWTQSLPDWIASHVRAFDFFGGVTAQIVSDNLKAGVTKACFYDPAINRTYADMASHYDTAVVPARPHKPKDKAKVEGTVLLVERWILARLLNRQFFSLAEVNTAIHPLLDRPNDKVSRHLGASRRQLFVQLDKPALKPLPVAPYVYAEWKKCRAGLDYHIAIDTCLGVIRLADKFGSDRLDAACRRALEINSRSYSSLQSILKNGLESKPRIRATEKPAITHPSKLGMTSSVNQPSRMPSSTASFTTLTASNSKGSPCEKQSPKWMTKTIKPDTPDPLLHGNASQVAGYPGIGGRMLSE